MCTDAIRGFRHSGGSLAGTNTSARAIGSKAPQAARRHKASHRPGPDFSEEDSREAHRVFPFFVAFDARSLSGVSLVDHR